MPEFDHTNHRQRLRKRFLDRDPDSSSDFFLLELLLTYAIPRKDVQPLARALLDRFGDLDRVFSASEEEIKRVEGIGEISFVLLKLFNYVRRWNSSIEPNQAADSSVESESAAEGQLSLFGSISESKNVIGRPKSEEFIGAHISSVKQNVQEATEGVPLDSKTIQRPDVNTSNESHAPTKAEKKKRKLQVSNGHFLEFDQLARLLYAIREHEKQEKITFAVLEEETGMPLRQVRNRVSIGRAMGLFHEKAIRLSDLGELVVSHDTFMEARATLEFLHFMAAGNRTNLIWYEVFNTLLVQEAAMDYEEWIVYFRKQLAGKYSKHSLKKHLSAEIRFVVDAYLQKNFRRLEILQESPDGRLFRPRYGQIEPIALCAMIYDYGAKQGLQLIQVEEMAVAPGSPSVVFGLDAETLRQKIETLHEQEWIRYETTHHLDQIRLKPWLSALEFLAAHYENRQPMAKNAQ